MKEASQPRGVGRPKGSKNKPRAAEIAVSTGRVERIALKDINLDDTTFKFRVNLRVGDLVESIRQDGQQFPILLRRIPGTGRFQIISGFRRTTAIRKLRWEHVNAIVREDLDDDAEACRISVIENEIRQTYNDLDRAYAILAYRNMGKTHAEIEELFNIGARQRQRLQKLTKFPAELQKAVEEGRVSSTNAVRLMQHVEKYPDTDLGQWIEKIAPNDEDGQEMTFRALNKALKDSIPEIENQPVQFFVKQEKNGKASMRIRPISISSDLSPAQRKHLVKDLRELLQFVEGLE